MSDHLDVTDIDEVLQSHLGSAWTGGPALYLQAAGDHEIEVHGNFALTTRGAQRFMRTVNSARLWRDVEPFVEAFDIRLVFVANQAVFRGTLEAFPDDSRIDVRRFVRSGDCQSGNSFGTNDEKEYCHHLLETAQGSERMIALLPVLGTALTFGLCNFRFDENMFFSSNLKICHPIAKIASVYIPALVAQKELRKVIVNDSELERELRSTAFFQRYPTFLTRLTAKLPADVTVDRTAIARVLAARKQTSGDETAEEPGLFGKWLRRARERHLGASKPQIISERNSGRTTHRAEALRAFYSAIEVDDTSKLRQILATTTATEGNLSGMFLVFTRSARVVAAGKLAAWSELPDALALARECDLDHPCREALVEWGTRARVATGGPVGWFEALTARDNDVIVKVARLSEENFDSVRRAVAEERPDDLAALFPFDTLGDEERYGQAVRDLYVKLRADGSDAATAFYDGLHDQWLPSSILRDLLVVSRARWGVSGNQLLWEVMAEVRAQTYEQALPLIEQWIALGDSAESTANAYYWRGECLQYLGRKDQAITAYRKAIEIDAEDSRPWRELGRCYWIANQYADGEEYARKAYELSQRAMNIEVLAGLLFDQKKFAEFIALTGGLTSEELKDSRLVRRLLLSSVHEEEWSSVTNRLEELVPLMDDGALSSFLWDATDVLESRDLDERVAGTFPELLKDTPDYADAAGVISDCLFNLGRCSEAFELTRRYTKYPKASSRIWCNLVDYTLDEGIDNAGEALRIAQEGLTHHPDCLFLLNRIGELTELTDGTGAGVSSFQRALDVVATDSEAANDWYTQYHLAIASYNLGDSDRARLAIQKCAELSSKWHTSFYFDAIVCLSCGDRDGAMTAYGKVKSLLAALPSVKQQINMRSHYVELEAYSRRGRIDPKVWQPIVQDVLGTLQL